MRNAQEMNTLTQWLLSTPGIPAAAAWTVADIAQYEMACDAEIDNIHLCG
jgi:hypothetical protein